MKFNDDDTSIDTLAVTCSTEDLSKTFATLRTIKNSKLSNGESIDENLAVIREAIKRQTESSIYMFHSYDGLGEAMGELWNRGPDGFSVYQRIGNKLKDIGGFGGSNIAHNNIGDYVKRNNIKDVFTGSIQGSFLGVDWRVDDEYAGETCRNETDMLKPDQVKLLRELGVNVRILNILT